MERTNKPAWQERLTPRIERFAKRIIGRVAPAREIEDVWQNVLLSIHTDDSANNVRDGDAFAKVVFNTARKAARSSSNKSRRDRLVPTETGDPMEKAGDHSLAASLGSDGFSDMAARELEQSLAKFLDGLAPELRQVILLHLQGCDETEMLELVGGITLTILRARLSRARQELATHLQTLEYEVPERFRTEDKEGSKEMQGPTKEELDRRLAVYSIVWNEAEPDEKPLSEDGEPTRSLYTDNPRDVIFEAAVAAGVELDRASTVAFLGHLRPWIIITSARQGPGRNQRMTCMINPLTLTNGGGKPKDKPDSPSPTPATTQSLPVGHAYRFLFQKHADRDPKTGRKCVKEIKRKLSGKDKYQGKEEAITSELLKRKWIEEGEMSIAGVEHPVRIHYLCVQPEETFGADRSETAPPRGDEVTAAQASPAISPPDGAAAQEERTQTPAPPTSTPPAEPETAPPEAKPATKPRRLKGGYFTQLEQLILVMFTLKAPKQEHGTWDTDLAPEIGLDAIKPAAAGCSDDDVFEAIGRLVDAKIVQVTPGGWRLAWNPHDLEIKRIERRRVIVCPLAHLEMIKRARALTKEMANDEGLIPLRKYASTLAAEWGSTDLEVLQLLLCEQDASGAYRSYGVVLIEGKKDMFDAEHLLLAPVGLMGCDFFKEKAAGTLPDPIERTQGPNFDEARATKRKQYREVAETFIAGPAGTMAEAAPASSSDATVAAPAATASSAQSEAPVAAEEDSARNGPRRRGPDRRPRKKVRRGGDNSTNAATAQEEAAPVVADQPPESVILTAEAVVQTPEVPPDIDPVAILSQRETELRRQKEALRVRALDNRASATRLRLEADELEERAKQHDKAQGEIDKELEGIGEQCRALQEAEAAEAEAERAVAEAERRRAEAAERKAALLRSLKT